MAFVTGNTGSVTIGSTPYCVENWSLNLTNELQEVTTTCSNGWVERIAGFSSGSASWSMYVPATDADDLINAFMSGAALASAKLKVGSTGFQYSGNFLVSGHNCQNPAKNPVKLDITAESSGAITVGAVS